MTPAQRTGLSIGLATGLYGISFGALSVAAGLSVLQTCALSALMFTGGSQFAYVGVLAGGGTGAAATGAATLLGVRNAVYGLQLNALLAPRGTARRLAMAHLTIDESTATAVSQEEPGEQQRGFWAAGLATFVLWNLFTLAGALLGDTVGDLSAWGLDGAAVAAFAGLLWPRLAGRDEVAIAILAAVTTLALVPLVPPGIPVLGAALVAAVSALLTRPASVRGTR
ncbi:Predicted branched-chain amino acid permease (azaleucine resistance) [Kytococcus aerolatus]|uniref:Predicted branched-chain amino acid permease (Azaleucine resistance) n=1 Tax=Kytococcus aerolatus TaxID=592308 RepID=A0A212TZN5_9MICO|nr:AzlC family ABC transporter permease [Kytococcus aerolatus]SNC71448.1 Predicted branched-chain amino acid permease (azaleucine resistance) [Kytococcus aerolatus]